MNAINDVLLIYCFFYYFSYLDSTNDFDNF